MQSLPPPPPCLLPTTGAHSCRLVGIFKHQLPQNTQSFFPVPLPRDVQPPRLKEGRLPSIVCVQPETLFPRVGEGVRSFRQGKRLWLQGLGRLGGGLQGLPCVVERVCSFRKRRDSRLQRLPRAFWSRVHIQRGQRRLGFVLLSRNPARIAVRCRRGCAIFVCHWPSRDLWLQFPWGRGPGARGSFQLSHRRDAARASGGGSPGFVEDDLVHQVFNIS